MHGRVETTSSKVLIENSEFFTRASLIQGDDVVEVDVMLIRDRRSKFTQLIIDKVTAHKDYVLYQSVEGKYWLRNKAEFFGMHETGVPRFERLSEELVFSFLMTEKNQKQT